MLYSCSEKFTDCVHCRFEPARFCAWLRFGSRMGFIMLATVYFVLTLCGKSEYKRDKQGFSVDGGKEVRTVT